MSGLEVVEQEKFLIFELISQAWMRRHFEKSLLILGHFKTSMDAWVYPPYESVYGDE